MRRKSKDWIVKYQEALEYIESLSQYTSVSNLKNMERLCEYLGNPQENLKFVHIAGTNAKGSTLAYISSVLKCAGYRVGSFASPAVFDFCEMIQVGGRPITHTAVAEGIALIKAGCEQIVAEGFLHPTVFEVETALAFWYLYEKECDVVVLEAQMGGRVDATNVIPAPLLSIITPISMDHMKSLGKTLSDIAAHKAGIMKTGCPVLTVCQPSEVVEVLQKEAALKQCPLTVIDSTKAVKVRYGLDRQRFDYGTWKNLEIGLAGTYQIENAVLALEAIRLLGLQEITVTEAALRKGMAQANCPGRFTVIGKKPLFLVDGAHNVKAAAALAESIERYFPNKRMLFIIGFCKDSEFERIIDLTHQYAVQIITVTPPGNPKGMSAYELACEVARVHPQVTAVDSLEEAVEISSLLAGKEDVILAFGSLTYVGKVMHIVEKSTKALSKKRR